MDKNLVHEFWIECMLSGFRDALNNNDDEALIKAIIKRADRDTMTGGRFNAVYSEHHNEYKALLEELIKMNKNNLNSRVLIDAIYQNVHLGVTVGLVQKLVNMTLKYLYAVDVFGYLTDLGVTVNIKKCDCPLDSIVLGHLKSKTGKEYVP